MRKNIGQKYLAAFVFFIALAFVATDASAYSIKQINMRFSAVAAETLATGNVVMLKTDGLAYKADANDAALRPAIGIIGKGGATGATVEIITLGILSGWTGLTEGAPGYLSETAAAVTQSAPAYSQQVGQAITATDYIVNFQNYFDSSSLTVLGTLSGATPLVFEGATADDFETSIAVTDPTADRTITLPDASGVPILSAAVPTAATSVYGAANAIVFEGATDDAHEVTLDVADPTADVTYRLPVAAAGTYGLMSSTLATNAPDIANSVWGMTNGLAFGGATGGDGFELQIKPMGDPAADKSVLIPVLTNAAVMISTLTTNDVNVANSVWGVSNGLAFGGATGADGFETTLTVTDPTSDKAVTIPDRTGQVQVASAESVLTPGAAVALTVGLSNIYTLAINDNEDTTITFSGAGTAGDELTIVVATGVGVVGDEVITFHATLVSSVGTLTAANAASKFYVIRFISNGTHWYEVSRTAVQT
ncbi:MAG: hypothetical protein KKD99_13620 [Proteobacteria bacterium]|nr:hypothetical protein [Pseudomonadota bacterium]